MLQQIGTKERVPEFIARAKDKDDPFRLMARGRLHDASKLEEPEKSTFDSLIPQLAGVAYGSPEYEAAAERAKPGVEHHYRRNSHHPEHYGPAGVAGMDLFDLVEMVCDWMAAAEREPEDGVKLAYNVAGSASSRSWRASSPTRWRGGQTETLRR